VAATYPDVVRAVVLEDPALQDKPPSQTEINKGLLVTGEEQPAQSGWQWLFELRALSREERIARGFALNPTWAQEEIVPWADSKAELNIAILEPALAACLIGEFPRHRAGSHEVCPRKRSQSRMAHVSG